MASNRFGLALALTAGIALAFAPEALAQTTDVNAEARVFFDRGNELLEQAGRVRGRRRRRLLEESLQAFVSTLRIVRSRNAIFNAALVLEQLERPGEAFGYYREYLAIPGLSDDERQQAVGRIDAVRPSIAIVSVTSTPADVEVFVDRLDLAARGRTPLQIALPAGEHTLFFRHPHFEDAEARVTAETGATREVEQALTARPIQLVLEAAEGSLTLNGEPVDAGRHSLPPGNYVARLEVPGRAPSERRFELEPGSDERTIRLEPGAIGEGSIAVQTNVAATVLVDGNELGSGREVGASLPPGPHRLRVAAEGFAAYESLVQIEAGRTSRVSVQLAEENVRPLGVFPHVALGVSAAAAAVWGGLGIRALRMKSDYDDACRARLPDCNLDEVGEIEDANLITDIMMGVAGALAITTVILYLVNRGGDGTSRADVQVSASPDGGLVQVGGRF